MRPVLNLYAQLIKIRSGRRLKFAITLPIFGTRGQIRDALRALGLSGRIQTGYVSGCTSFERIGTTFLTG